MTTTTPSTLVHSRAHTMSPLPQPTDMPCEGSSDTRCLTVSYFYPTAREFAPLPKPMPYSRLLGRWLERAGFAVGARVRVHIEPRRLLLEVIEDENEDSTASTSTGHEPLYRSLDMGPHIV